MNTIAGSLSQVVVLAPSIAAEAPQPDRRRGARVVEMAEQALFAVGILGSAVMTASFFWQMLQ
jgi:hypothetical protein